MGIQTEALEIRLDMANRLLEEHKGELMIVCFECLTPQLQHTQDVTHRPKFWPISHVIAEVTKEIDLRRCLESGVI